MMAPMPYYCIHCGNEEPQVYKTYAKGNLVKLLHCTNCNELIDQYVEYDPIIVVMNLVLLNTKAYRHILLNTAFMEFWKFGIVFLFCEAYCFWCFQQGKKNDSVVDFYELEINFYRVLLRTCLSTIILHVTMFVSVFIQILMQMKLPNQFSYLTLWKGLCLSGFGILFELLGLIWSYSDTTYSILFVNCLLALSHSKSYQVVTGVKKYPALLITMFCLFVQKSLLLVCDNYLFPSGSGRLR